MTNNTDITSPIPNKIRQVASVIRRIGRIGFWSQIVLGVISAVTLLFASPILLENEQRTQGNEFGVFCAVCALILLAVAIYFSWRYIRIATLIQEPDPALRPKKSNTLQVIRIGLTVNLIGMLLAIVGAEALVGIVLAKSLARPQLALGSNPSEFVNSLDLLIVQANTNTITAHFAGIASSLWLLNRIAR